MGEDCRTASKTQGGKTLQGLCEDICSMMGEDFTRTLIYSRNELLQGVIGSKLQSSKALVFFQTFYLECVSVDVIRRPRRDFGC